MRGRGRARAGGAGSWSSHTPSWRRARLLLGLILLQGCTGGAGYLLRAGWSEARILWRRRPIAELLARPDLDPALRERLQLALAVRAFAEHPLGLRVGQSYTTFADVEGEDLVYVVSAAWRDRLEAYTWRYPLVGRLPYRGYFAHADADAAAQALVAQDLDVDVHPAVAFSTLGWFADPLLSSAATGPPVAVAETIFHELFHATLYLAGNAPFNESAATFVGHRGAIAFFCTGPGADAGRCDEARRRWSAVRTRGRILGRLAARLRQLYATHPTIVLREQRRTGLLRVAAAALARRGLGDGELLPPNNARLLGDLLYLTELDTFDRLAPRDSDLGPAIATLVRSVRGSADPFATLAALASRDERR